MIQKISFLIFLFFSLFSTSLFTLELSYPLLDRIELYIPSDSLSEQDVSGFAVKKAGDTLPFKEREMLHQNFLFYLPIESVKDQTFYLRIESKESVQIPLTIRSYKKRIILKEPP